MPLPSRDCTPERQWQFYLKQLWKQESFYSSTERIFTFFLQMALSTLGGVISLQSIVAADNRVRKMVCFPEFYVYGWILGIQSKSKDLQKYQWKCYEILYNRLHGAITERCRS